MIDYLQSGNRGRDSKTITGLLDSNKLIHQYAMGEAEHTLTPAVTWALTVVSVAGMDGMSSVVLVMNVDVEVAGLGTCIEPRVSFLNPKTFLKIRFISLIIKVNEKDPSIT